jgi:iron complex outermembrane recepter protein
MNIKKQRRLLPWMLPLSISLYLQPTFCEESGTQKQPCKHNTNLLCWSPGVEQPLSTWLAQMCKEAGLQIVYSSYMVKDLTTSVGPKSGQSIDESLTEVLKGTGLTWEYVNPHTVTLIRERKIPDTELPRRPAQASGSTEPTPKVTVTGSHIPGSDAIGTYVIRISRDEIDASGWSTVQDVVRSLPQNFSRGPSDILLGHGPGIARLANASLGSGLDLRGLGTGSTLILLNGRRWVAGAADGRFADISAIPLSAVASIEILPDGASAIYGADAVGGVVNFLLRTDATIETRVSAGSAAGGPDERQASQTIGRRWESGQAFGSVDYFYRSALQAAARTQTAFSDLRFLGGDNFDSLEGSPGTILTPEGTYAIPRGQNGTELDIAKLSAGTANLHNRNAGVDLMPRHERVSFVGNARQQVGQRSELFVDTLVSRRWSDALSAASSQLLLVPTSNAFNKTGGPVAMYYGFADDLGFKNNEITATSGYLVGGVETTRHPWTFSASLMRSMSHYDVGVSSFLDRAELDVALADSNAETAFNPFGDGSFTNSDTLKKIRTTGAVRNRTDVWQVVLASQGTIFQMPAGDVKFAGGVDIQSQTLHSRAREGRNFVADVNLSRKITAVRGEVLAPLMGPNKTHKHPQLTLSLAGRYEEYGDFGSATVPRIGIEWSPTDHTKVHASASKSYKAPALQDLDESTNGTIIVAQRDSSSSTGMVPVLLRFGGNADLKEQKSRSLTLGFDLHDLPTGASISATYFNLQDHGRAEIIEYSDSFLEDGMYRDIVTRHPSQSERERICAHGTYYGPPSDCLSAPVEAIVDMRIANVASVETSGIDVLADYGRRLEAGAVAKIGLNATYIFGYDRTEFRNAPKFNVLDTQSNPLNFRLRGYSSINYRGIDGRVTLNYSDDYRDIASVPVRKVGSWTTFDAQVSYELEPLNLRLSMSALNVFDRDPPFLNNRAGVGFDPENADILKRLVSVNMIKTW